MSRLDLVPHLIGWEGWTTFLDKSNQCIPVEHRPPTYLLCEAYFPVTWPVPSQPTVGHLGKEWYWFLIPHWTNKHRNQLKYSLRNNLNTYMYLTSWCSCCCILAASGHPDKLKYQTESVVGNTESAILFPLSPLDLSWNPLCRSLYISPFILIFFFHITAKNFKRQEEYLRLVKPLHLQWHKTTKRQGRSEHIAGVHNALRWTAREKMQWKLKMERPRVVLSLLEYPKSWRRGTGGSVYHFRLA